MFEVKNKDPSRHLLAKVNNENTRTMYENCSKLTIKSPELQQWRVFISHIVLVFPLLTLNK